MVALGYVVKFVPVSVTVNTVFTVAFLGLYAVTLGRLMHVNETLTSATPIIETALAPSEQNPSVGCATTDKL
jgi:hypothetical protein